jgi:hypothetical protein
MAKQPKIRRQRRHGDLPAGFAWREGRPRWEPSPARRAQGWKGCKLQDTWGRYLTRGPAIEKAGAIAAAVDAWAAGAAVPGTLAAIAPRGACEAGKPQSVGSARSIGVLMDEYIDTRLRRKAPATQRDYRGKLRRFLEVLAGSADPAKVERVKALDIDVLLPPAPGEGGEFELQRAYDLLLTQTGKPMASGTLAVVGAWCGWIVKPKRLWATNPCSQVERETPDGRIVVWEWPELVALVRSADALGLASIGDAVILGVDLSWNQQDLLALTWGQVRSDGRVTGRRIKTNIAGSPKLLPIGLARLKAIAARRPDVKPLPVAPVLVCELTGRKWVADTFRHKFAQVRAHAAKELPTIACKRFQDLRDTAVTVGIDAGLTLEQICSRTMHDPASAQAVITKHYGAIGRDVADAGAAKLEAHFKALGLTFDAPLALPAPSENGR